MQNLSYYNWPLKFLSARHLRPPIPRWVPSLSYWDRSRGRTFSSAVPRERLWKGDACVLNFRIAQWRKLRAFLSFLFSEICCFSCLITVWLPNTRLPELRLAYEQWEENEWEILLRGMFERLLPKMQFTISLAIYGLQRGLHRAHPIRRRQGVLSYGKGVRLQALSKMSDYDPPLQSNIKITQGCDFMGCRCGHQFCMTCL